jgi:alpha-2-macroglobulin
MRPTRTPAVVPAACLPALVLAASWWLAAAAPSAFSSPVWASSAALLPSSPPGAGSTAAVEPAPTAPAPVSAKVGWQRVEALAERRNFEPAIRLAAELRERARAAGDEAGWLHALVRETQLRIAWHGYQAAASFLGSQPWPRSPLYRTTLDLYYAQALVSYYGGSSWEIDRRERVESSGPLDLERCTRDQLFAAAIAAYLDAWRERSVLGEAPVGRLAEYLEPNDYPAGVRGTLRDALAYLFVELLADTSFWTPRESNELYLLDLPDLIAGSPPAVAPSAAGGALAAPAVDRALGDPAIHPLAKLAAVLGDLEAWHTGAGRRAAAFEARLERLGRLHAALTRPSDRALIRADLERRLPELRSDPWWAAGVARLAELTRQMNDPDAVRRAHELLLRGEAAYPGSPGGKRCRALREDIEVPDFNLVAMAGDAPGRRSLQVTHWNLPRLFFRAYLLDVRRRLERGEEVKPDTASVVAASRPVASWTTELPATPDYRQHQTYVTPPLAAAGVYLVVASVRKDFAAPGNRLEATVLALGDLVLLTRSEGDREISVGVVSGSTGEPQVGVEVRFYSDDREAPRPAAVATTGADGFARLRYLASKGYGSGAVLAVRGREVAFTTTWVMESGKSPAGELALIYTDRSIYRPGQKVLWKVLAYATSGNGFPVRALRANPVTVTLRAPNGLDVARAVVTTNEFGTAAGEFTLPTGQPLGGWQINCTPGGGAAIQVEEYKRPTFEVQLLDPAQPLRLNRPARLRGQARYYFGLPVTGGRVSWRVRRQPVYPSWWEEWERSDPGGAPSGQGEDQVVAAGQAVLDAGGGFELAFTPRADERESRSEGAVGGESDTHGGGAGGGGVIGGESRPERTGDDARGLSYRYLVTAEVTGDGGETRQAERGFRLGWVAVEAEIRADSGFLRAGQPARLRISRRDLDGTSRPGEGTWRLVELRQPPAAALPSDEPPAPPPLGAFTTPGDRLRPRWAPPDPPAAAMRRWADGRELASGTVRHDGEGQAGVELPPLPPGAYRLRYETRDDFGARCPAAYDLVVAGPVTPLALPAVLLVESPTVRVGGTVRLLVRSGLPDQAYFVEVQRGEHGESLAAADRFRRLSLRSGRDAEVLELPVTAEDRGGIAVRLVVVRDHQVLQLDATVFVPWDDHQLQLEFTTFRDRLRPGAGATWRVKVRPADGSAPEAVAAELLAYMYDRSLDQFVPHQPPSLLDSLPGWGAIGAWASTADLEEAEDLRSSGWPPAVRAFELHGDRLRLGGPWSANLPEPFEDAITVAAEPERSARPGAVQAPVAAGRPAPVAPPKPVPAARPPAAPPPQLRADFGETAFWQPHLLTGADGTADIEFRVPDSVTGWNVWVQAVTQDLRTGSVHRQAQSVKELMVRPYLPRFLREGDRAEIAVAVDNASPAAMEGELRLDILDPESGRSLAADFGLAAAAAARTFRVGPGGGASLRFAVTTPRRVGPVAFKVTATAGEWSDGELRALPVLPSRLHLTQSRFVALRGGGPDRREMTFPDLRRDDDPTRRNEQLVVTLDAQLFYGALRALPYLVDYPYECTEQTLNRFLSTGIVSSLFARYPAVAAVAKDLAGRETRYAAWDAADPNRKMAIEETPWLRVAQGGEPGPDRDRSQGAGAGADPELIRVLDPRIARAERDAALGRLQQAQLASGAFPWWPGGPASPYMTLYLMYGFAKAAEFGVEVPHPLVAGGWNWLAAHYRDQIVPELNRGKDVCCLEFLTFLNYVASSYPDPSWIGDVLTGAERQRILELSFRHRRTLSPYLQGLLALTLKRAGRPADARLVWDVVMNAARTTPEEGTFWAPEENAWVWYRDTLEFHALALRVLTELSPDDPRAEGVVQWLFLNRQLNHWKSTRATAEVLYALAGWLGRQGRLAARETATVSVGGRSESFVFEPDRYTGGRNRLVVAGPQLDPRRDATVVVEKQTPGLMFAAATWDFSTEALPQEARGDLFAVSRAYFRRVKTATETVLRPLTAGEALAVGDEIEVQLSLRSAAPAEYVHLRDPRAAGLEPIAALSGYRWDLGVGWYEETRDSGANFFFESLPAGEHMLRYRLRANLAGTFRVGPATVQSMYAPEFAAYSAGNVLTVGPAAPPAPGPASGPLAGASAGSR